MLPKKVAKLLFACQGCLDCGYNCPPALHTAVLVNPSVFCLCLNSLLFLFQYKVSFACVSLVYAVKMIQNTVGHCRDI